MVSRFCLLFQYVLSCNVATIKQFQYQYEGKDGYLKFFEINFSIIDQRKPGRLSTSKLCAKTERLDCLFWGFIERGEPSANFIFGEVSIGRMEDIDDLDGQLEE